MPSPPIDERQAGDNEHWARPVSRLRVGSAPSGAININLDGREMMGALQGFGQLWRKTFKVRLSGVKAAPEEVMQVWKENFPRFQPAPNHFYPSMAGIKPGEVIWIDTRLPVIPGLPGLVPIASGVMVLYVDDTTFTVMTPAGFPISGWNNFSVYEEDGSPVAQVESYDRPSDPIYEFGFRLMGGSPQQDKIWITVLERLAEHYGVKGQAQVQQVCLDPKLQWRYWKNVRHNAMFRTMLYVIGTPFRWIGKLLKLR